MQLELALQLALGRPEGGTRDFRARTAEAPTCAAGSGRRRATIGPCFAAAGVVRMETKGQGTWGDTGGG